MSYYNNPTGNCEQAMMHNLQIPLYGHHSKTPKMPLLNEACESDEMDFKFQIHNLEKEAYCSVLKAFIAQSDLLSWAKEGLMTELRKELNVTDMEHSQLLAKINSDESTKKIRERRNRTHESIPTNMNVPDLTTNSVEVAAPLKKRSSHPSLPKSQKRVLYDQPCAATIPPLPQLQEHIRDKKHHSEASAFAPKVTLKIPDSNLGAYVSNKGFRVGNRVSGTSQSYLQNVNHSSDARKFKDSSEAIVIRATDVVIHEVKRMAYGTVNPDPDQVKKAKLILSEHERDILQALKKLSYLTDKGDCSNQASYESQELHGNRRGMFESSDFHGQADRLHSYLSRGY